MKRYDSPIDAAMDIYNAADTTTHARLSAILRTGLKQSRAPLRAVKVTYGARLPASALLAIMPTFSGRVIASLTLDDITPPERDGFYRRGSEEFHPNSVDYERGAEIVEAEAAKLVTTLIGAGVNVIQAADMLPMSSLCTVALEGTLEDFADLYFEHGPVSQGSHPAARQLAIDVWADIATRYKAFAEAYMEAGR